MLLVTLLLATNITITATPSKKIKGVYPYNVIVCSTGEVTNKISYLQVKQRLIEKGLNPIGEEELLYRLGNLNRRNWKTITANGITYGSLMLSMLGTNGTIGLSKETINKLLPLVPLGLQTSNLLKSSEIKAPRMYEVLELNPCKEFVLVSFDRVKTIVVKTDIVIKDSNLSSIKEDLLWNKSKLTLH